MGTCWWDHPPWAARICTKQPHKVQAPPFLDYCASWKPIKPRALQLWFTGPLKFHNPPPKKEKAPSASLSSIVLAASRHFANPWQNPGRRSPNLPTNIQKCQALPLVPTCKLHKSSPYSHLLRAGRHSKLVGRVASRQLISYKSDIPIAAVSPSKNCCRVLSTNSIKVAAGLFMRLWPWAHQASFPRSACSWIKRLASP